ncbi:MAG: fused MFS/spermidine synthase [Longimicrobiales bacterium]|nr:fused MFS/spermidine synthase [Longimicrobiales bacterium]
MDPLTPAAEAAQELDAPVGPDGASDPHPHGARRAGLFFLAFASGFAVLTIEIAGARLIAPVFGLSVVPWTAVIGVILAALAVGSHVGGRLADGERIPLSAVLVAAGFTGVLPVLGSGVPWHAQAALGFVGGAVASAVVLFAPSVFCLGAVVPYLVQADTESLGNVGRRAGDVSAAATAGSIAGSFVTGFVLLPALPVTVLLGLTSAGLLALAGLSGWILGRRAPAELLALGALGLSALGAASARPGPETLFQTQTLYASVQVTEREGEGGRRVRTLRQNGGSSSAEYVDTGDPAHGYVDASALILEPVIGNVRSMLVLGGAALSLPVAFSRWRPHLRIDVVEIDPVVTRLAREYFAYGRGEYPGIRVTHDDARVYLRRTSETYDLVYLDVFDHLLSVPWTMVTEEALSDMDDRLEPDGLFVANVLSPIAGPGAAFLQRFLSTLGEVFPEVRVYAADAEASPGVIQSLIVVAGRDPAALPDTSWPRAPVGPAGRPLTDAWAPVEYLQAKLFLHGAW